MPQPVSPGQRYLPGLDGLRAVAVAAVVLYHLGFGWAVGGLLGVGVFFTLSGYLITDLLLARLAVKQMRLGDFWRARARRLLPALFVLLAAVSIWVAVAGTKTSGFGRAVVGALLYVANWQMILHHVSYFARFGPPSPLDHLWSLGIEEQFYIVWPLLLILGVRVVRERTRVPGVRPRLALLTLLLAAASAIEMAVLYKPSFDSSRVYFGTDTRAFELLAGAALAMVWPSRRLRANVSASARRVCDVCGLAGLVVIAMLVWRTNQYSPFLYQGGFVLLTVATVLLVAALVHPAAHIGRLLGVAPLRWIGERSYGIYLWHMPILVLTTPDGAHGTNLARDALQVTATLSLAALSWKFIEEPIRHGALGRTYNEMRAGTWRLPRLARPGMIALAQAALMLSIGAFALGAASGAGKKSSNGLLTTTHGTTTRPTSTTSTTTLVTTTTTTLHGTTISTTTTTTTTTAHHVTKHKKRFPTKTSCTSVVDIGDSTSEGLMSPNYIPNAKRRQDAQFTKVGAVTQHFEISGARSIVETYQGAANAADVAQYWENQGYHGCWVLALGTNDTADVYVGSNTDQATRIERMMSLIGTKQPVLWVNVKSLLSSGPYSQHQMEIWDDALLHACHQHKNMRIFDWASLVKDGWFIDDGIHYTSPGYAARAHLIARALARAFPDKGHTARCLVR